MAAPSYGHDLTDWILDNDVAAWGELTNAIAGGAPDEVDTESALQGTNSVSQSQNTTALCSMCRILGNSVTFTSDQVALVWHGHGVATALATYNNGGFRVAFAGNALGNWKSYTVGGSDVPPHPYGKWVNNAVDPSLTPDATNGTPPTGGTNIFGIGSMSQLTQAVAKGQPHVCDIIRYGRAEARFSGGDSTNGYATFTGFATLNDAQTARWGLIQKTDGGFLWKGLMTLGHGSAVDFRDSNKTIFVQDTRKVSATFNKIEVRQSTSRVDWSGISIVCLSPSTTASKGAFEVIDDADVNKDGCTFIDLTTFKYLSNSSVNSTTYRRCGQVIPSGAAMDNNQFINGVINVGEGYLRITSTSDTNSSRIKNLTFTNTTGTSTRAIVIAGTYSNDSQNPTAFYFDNFEFSTDLTIDFVGTGHISITPQNGGNISQGIVTASGGGTATVLTTPITFTVNNIPAGAEVRIRQGSYTLHYGSNITSGSLAYNYYYSGDEPVRVSATLPGYTIEVIDTVLGNENSSVSLVSVPDPSYV